MFAHAYYATHADPVPLRPLPAVRESRFLAHAKRPAEEGVHVETGEMSLELIIPAHQAM